jgi:hypothetical protein
MIAKTGIIVSTAVAGLLAVSPLAYAACNHDKHQSSHNNHGGHHYVQADYQHRNNHGGWDGRGDNDHGRGNNSSSSNNSGDKSCKQQTAGVSTRSGRGGGLINISNNTIQVPVQACNNNILSNIGLGILGSGRANSH